MEACPNGKEPVSKTGGVKAPASSSLAASAMKVIKGGMFITPSPYVVLHTTRNEIIGMDTQVRRKAMDFAVIIVDGKIVKNRFGRSGINIEGAIFVWEHEEVEN